jgi:hypothetical protein
MTGRYQPAENRGHGDADLSAADFRMGATENYAQSPINKREGN